MCLLLALEGGTGRTMGSLWEHLRHMGVTLAPLWGYFAATLGSVWVSVGDLASLDGHFAIIVESLWVYESHRSKNTHFPNRL